MKLLLLAGDDIGPEIMAPTKRALIRLNEKFDLGLDFEERSIGMEALQAEGTTLPDAVMESARAADGVVLGPVGTFKYPPKEQGGINISAAFRISMDLYANIRPSKTRPGVPSMAKQMDLVIVRENTEGFYADRTMFAGTGEFMPTEDLAMSMRKITREGSRRIAVAAFELARTRRKKVTIVHKANVLKITDGLFLSVARQVAADYPDVEVEDVIVDAMAALLIRKPEAFDVIVATNMFGDILSDEAAELSGGLGLGGSINASAERAIAQAAHGSAPDIAGQGIANPAALMSSAAMLLAWLAQKNGSNALAQASELFIRSVDHALADPVNHTPDLGGPGSTAAFGDAVVAQIES
ncbi:MAG: isocitrate/isopropylmalate dehydrogenase family protein [Rhodospirillales bacterium]|nr:isocitrate/isopropylmalate dehydrogenase family protein [Rhodospirillales bacterium]